jgi:hypothetical protein
MKIENTALPFDLLEPWGELPDDGSRLLAELHRELRTDHILYGVEARAIAMRCDCDDVLFRIEGRPEQFAVVHLTWSGTVDPNKGWPSTDLFADIEDWRTTCMMPDHEDYTV